MSSSLEKIMNIFLCAFLLVSLAHPALADGIEEKFFINGLQAKKINDACANSILL